MSLDRVLENLLKTDYGTFFLQEFNLFDIFLMVIYKHSMYMYNKDT